MGKSELWKIKVARCGDILFDDAREGDIIVPVMGLTGVGKSTFINNYLDQLDVARVGHDLTPCTEILQAFCSPLPSDETGKARRLVLVDTPGFGDADGSDPEILRRIAVWLASSYGPGKTCGGLIYLHDTTDAGMRGTTLQNLKVFQSLCGRKNLGSVVFATTKSGELTPEASASREKQLSDVYWRDFETQGVMIFKLLNSHRSADELVRTILHIRKDARDLLIQKELVDLAKILPGTEAGRELKYTLEEIIKHQKKALAGEELTDEQISDHKNNIAMVSLQLAELTMKPSFSQRLLKFSGLGG